MRVLSVLMFCTFFSIPSAQAQPTAAGLWQTIDDATKKPMAQIRLVDEAGTLRGSIVKLLDPNDKPDSVCDLCSDERKGKPIVGMTILRNLKRDGQTNTWSGGDVLDPGNGKLYRAKLTLATDSKSLEMRGYIGTPLLGRSQTWIRLE